jgi:hypothetical protein
MQVTTNGIASRVDGYGVDLKKVVEKVEHGL